MIEAKSLTMYYGTTKAVESVNFRVGRGEILGLLGPNGAGKTTIMNILTTQIVPTSGTASVNGCDILAQPLEVRRSTGYLPENVPLYMDMEVGEYLHFVAEGRGLEGPMLRRQLDWVVEKCAVKPMLKRLIAHLSKGYRQRVGLAQALVHDPKVLVLDEPTSGLDPLQIIGIRALVKELAADKTIIVSTHILQEVEAVSDRIIIINEGRIIADGLPSELQQAVARAGRRTITLQGDPVDIETALQDLPSVAEIERLEEPTAGGLHSFRLTAKANHELWPEVAAAALAKGWLVKDSWEEKPTLEEAFIDLTRASMTCR